MKMIKILLTLALFITLLPMQVHANENTVRDQIQKIVEEKVSSYAKKINKSNSNIASILGINLFISLSL